MNWYEERIEQPIREIVKLLRNNGVNTTSSCGHEMYVECQHIIDGEAKQIHEVLFNSGYRNYSINTECRVENGYQYNSMKIEFYRSPTAA